MSVLVVFAFGISLAVKQQANSTLTANAEGQADPNAQVAGANTVKQDIDQAKLTSEIQAVLKKYPNLDTGVSVVGTSNATVYDTGDNAAYYAASVSKLISASDFLSHVQDGTYSMKTQVAGDTAKVQLEKLIVDSDNTAWQGFIQLLGHPELERFAKANGVTFDATDNKLTSHDTAVLLKKLYGNQLLSKYNTNLLLSYMNRASSGQYLEANVPAGGKVYQKAGWLSDRLHVTGIVTVNGKGYIVAIFSKVNGTYDFAVGQRLISDIEIVLNNNYITAN